MGGTGFINAESAAACLASTANARIVVTDGKHGTAMAENANVVSSRPTRIVTGGRFSGAGDALAAGHIAAELSGTPARKALDQAVDTAVRFLERLARENDLA